jgi:hypothetical protein
MPLLASFLVAALATSPANDVKISNVRAGLVCTNGVPTPGQTGWICHVTDLILETDQGTCVYDKKNEPCTWHGFEFDYSATTAGTKIQCAVHSSEPTDTGTPEGPTEKGVDSYSFELTLPDTKGHFFNPQYYLFSVHSSKRDLLEETTCSYDGAVLFTIRFRFRFPSPTGSS